MRRATSRAKSRWALALGTAAIVAIACGEVPTLPDGVAYITTVLLPLPTVAAGDSLRDSLGHAAPLRVRAFGRDSQEILGLPTTFVTTSLPADVTIDANGFLVARDTVRAVRLVGRVGDQLQTTVATLLIVPDPSAVGRPAADLAGDTVLTLPALRVLPVTVTSVYRGEVTPVNGIIVRYRIDSLRPAGLPSGRAVLTNASGAVNRPDSTIAVDTTDATGNASRTLLVLAGTGVETVFVSASARRLHDGQPLEAVRFVVRVRQAP
jgi:hypothetical protein